MNYQFTSKEDFKNTLSTMSFTDLNMAADIDNDDIELKDIYYNTWGIYILFEDGDSYRLGHGGSTDNAMAPFQFEEWILRRLKDSSYRMDPMDATYDDFAKAMEWAISKKLDTVDTYEEFIDQLQTKGTIYKAIVKKVERI